MYMWRSSRRDYKIRYYTNKTLSQNKQRIRNIDSCNIKEQTNRKFRSKKFAFKVRGLINFRYLLWSQCVFQAWSGTFENTGRILSDLISILSDYSKLDKYVSHFLSFLVLFFLLSQVELGILYYGICLFTEDNFFE